MLQGSLDNFALDEVLGLLAGTSKTGQLDISGDRGSGSLKFDEGKLVGGTASHTANGTELEDVMFELLRYADGTFSFDSREIQASGDPENVASVLATSENRLRDWRLIEAVVPTLNHQVTPAEDLPEDEVTISRGEWAALTVIAAGCPVSLVCDRLHLGEVEGSRQIKNLAERKLVAVGEPLGSFGAVARSTASPTGIDPSIPASGDTTGTVPPPTLSEMPLSAASSLTTPAFESNLDSDEAVPPVPPPPTAADLQIEDSMPLGDVPPAPPSPAEISDFGNGVEDASELVEAAGVGDGDDEGGLLMRYLKNED